MSNRKLNIFRRLNYTTGCITFNYLFSVLINGVFTNFTVLEKAVPATARSKA